MNDRKTGFTLIELLGVITILALLALIIVPNVTKSISNAKDKAFAEQINTIETAAKKWGVEHDSLLPDVSSTNSIYITLKRLMDDGVLQDSTIKNPKTGGYMNGLIKVNYDSTYNQYIYEYSEDVFANCKVTDSFISPGDVNEDGLVNVNDYSNLGGYVNAPGHGGITINSANADVDRSEVIDSNDVSSIDLAIR